MLIAEKTALRPPPEGCLSVGCSFQILVEVLFQRGKGGAADDVLDLAGVIDRGFLIHAERHEQLAEDGVAFVGAFRDLKSRFGQVQTAVAGNGDIASVTQDSDRAADAWLGVAHFLADVDRAYKAFSVAENQNGLQVHFTGFFKLHNHHSRVE